MFDKKLWRALVIMAAVLFFSGLACQQLARPASQPVVIPAGGTDVVTIATPTATINPLIPPTRVPGSPYLTPTPDAPHPLPTPRTSPDNYTVQSGDSLAQIAARYGVSYQVIVDANQITNPNLIDVGLQLIIPPPDPDQARPDFKIIPDSELVYGPYSAYFPIDEYVQTQGGYLSGYTEELDEETTLTGAEIVQRVAREYSVNPRLLLAVLEHASGWVTRAEPDEDSLDYPLGILGVNRQGLYLQLTYAANELNRGYYLWRVNGVATWVLADGDVLLPSPRVNAGTAGVQNFYSKLYGRADWETAIGPSGLFATYIRLFGYPFDYALDPLVPSNLHQPALELPFEAGDTWAFTGGPHGGWGDGSAWAALDFAPPGDQLGCVESDAWVVAMAPGLIVRAENGAVVQDLDGDGLEQTGWTLLYMHIESRDRVKPGDFLQVGDRIGHASCEGGFSTGTHVHLARRYNGEWIPADGDLPFELGGWVSAGAGREYDGYLILNDQTIEAWNGRSEINQIRR
jgi:murein DD-endopeptidase MepM/ murein hydrolase activator NlpD